MPVKKIYAAANLVEAQLLKDLLQQAGIVTHLFNQNAQSGLGEIPFTHAYPEIWLVDERDEPRAARVLKEYEQVPLDKDTVYCSKCRERNPDNFALCWNCGSAL